MFAGTADCGARTTQRLTGTDARQLEALLIAGNTAPQKWILIPDAKIEEDIIDTPSLGRSGLRLCNTASPQKRLDGGDYP
ncbi:hypothetical protein AOE01nite_18060 [Acetobacter oeni]|uniref:Uncharacterized protein n=1 Tax=Acetobacter oeni TaxID=304077 RepID=A0A511XKV7_9PROT|nr:hypothetical protein AA21952_2480 [Acetobacter oeni LMG 21952]GEN63582.1 hypothetical protein AOE01nite_18060 [Acetobacter oeni]